MRAPLLAMILAACSAAPDGPPPRQATIAWPQAHRLYVADSRQGTVYAFSTWDTPRAPGEGRAPGRRHVLDMKLDAASGRLWVLGDDAVYLHDATSLVLLRRYPLAIAAGSRLQLDDRGAVTVAVR